MFGHGEFGHGFFGHGVASADPLPDGILLWTRCAGPATVSWEVAADQSMSDPVATGTCEALAERDFTVHVDVRGLEPATTYWYRFIVEDGAQSPIGRTRTAPGPGSETDRLRIGLVSCSSWPGGYFNAYRHLAARDVDLVVHVGDYVYEYERRPGPRSRADEPAGSAVTLADYRARHAHYRTDPDLLALHARHPMVAVWDDHDVAGGSWTTGALRHDPVLHGSWDDRLAAGIRAWREWVPVRSLGPAGDRTVYRHVSLGPLADLFMLDTRFDGRDQPAVAARPAFRIDRRPRALLGEAQWAWLAQEVDSSQARWKLVGNQVVMARIAAVGLAGGLGVNADQWDGYPHERQRLFDLFAARGKRVVVLSGDLHSAWASDLPVGAEFVTPAVSAPSFGRVLVPRMPGAAWLAARWFLLQNRHLRFGDLTGHGYVVVDVTPERVQADWWLVDLINQRRAGERWAAGWILRHGADRLEPASTPADDVPFVK